MALDFTRLRDDITAKINADADGKYSGGTPKPDTSAAGWDAFLHYICKAIVEEIDDNAELNSVSTGTPGVVD